jgi:hypothetical protein
MSTFLDRARRSGCGVIVMCNRVNFTATSSRDDHCAKESTTYKFDICLNASCISFSHTSLHRSFVKTDVSSSNTEIYDSHHRPRSHSLNINNGDCL